MTYLPGITNNWIVFVLRTHHNRIKHLWAIKTVIVISFLRSMSNSIPITSKWWMNSQYMKQVPLDMIWLCFSPTLTVFVCTMLRLLYFCLGAVLTAKLKPVNGKRKTVPGSLGKFVLSFNLPRKAKEAVKYLAPYWTRWSSEYRLSAHYMACYPTRGSIHLSPFSYSHLTLLHSLCRSIKKRFSSFIVENQVDTQKWSQFDTWDLCLFSCLHWKGSLKSSTSSQHHLTCGSLWGASHANAVA